MLKLHFAPNSRAGRIVWLLEELGLDYEVNRMDFHPKDLKSDEHRERHPLGRVPVLDDGDVSIYESGAIVEYVLARHGDGGLKPAVDSPEFPEYLQWFHYAEGMIMPPMNTLVVETILLPPERRTEINVKRSTKLLNQMLTAVDQHMAGREYLTSQFTAADIMTGHAVIMAGELGADLSDKPNLPSYIERLRNRPALKVAWSL